MTMPACGADYSSIKQAMVALSPRLKAMFPEAQMLLQVHDELVFEVPEGQAEALGDLVKEVMEGGVTLDVPLEVNVSWGKTWLEAH